jgi:hypothetical protein
MLGPTQILRKSYANPFSLMKLSRQASKFNLLDLKTFQKSSLEHSKIIDHLTSKMTEEEKLIKTARMVGLEMPKEYKA